MIKTIEETLAIPKLEAIIQNEGTHFDLIIVGGGPAGLTAAIYAGRARLKTLIIEKALLGGMASTTFHIDNYPGFPEGISGMELSHKLETQARALGVKIYYGNVAKIAKDRTVEIEGYKLKAKALIIATGTETKKLGIPGEEEFRGRGVSYCATCDGPFYRDKNIAVIGGGNAAVEEALYLTRFANKISIIYRRDKLRADKILAEHALNDPKIFVIWNSIVEKIEGDKLIKSVSIYNSQTNVRTTVPVDGVFIYIGSKPNNELISGILRTNKDGYIETDNSMKTSAAGIFACGDVIAKPLRQVVTAAADGAIAADSARKFIEEDKTNNKRSKK